MRKRQSHWPAGRVPKKWYGLLFWYHSQLLTVETEIIAYRTVLYRTVPLSGNERLESVFHQTCLVGVDRLSAWLIIAVDIKHFYDYRYRPFSKSMCR